MPVVSIKQESTTWVVGTFYKYLGAARKHWQAQLVSLRTVNSGHPSSCTRGFRAKPSSPATGKHRAPGAHYLDKGEGTPKQVVLLHSNYESYPATCPGIVALRSHWCKYAVLSAGRAFPATSPFWYACHSVLEFNLIRGRNVCTRIGWCIYFT